MRNFFCLEVMLPPVFLGVFAAALIWASLASGAFNQCQQAEVCCCTHTVQQKS